MKDSKMNHIKIGDFTRANSYYLGLSKDDNKLSLTNRLYIAPEIIAVYPGY